MKRRPVGKQGQRGISRGVDCHVSGSGDSDMGLHARCGFSLIEVIVATAILMGSVIVLARLAGMGRTMAQKTQLHSDAQRVCEQTLNEILLGLRPLEPVEQAPLDSATLAGESSEIGSQQQVADDRIVVRQVSGRWLHSVRLQPHTQIPVLQTLTVVVESADDRSERPVRFRLSRFVRMPGDDVSERATMGDFP
ncbi:MAG: prepilin-type N-terminal cleavage/methylation domain-containing protein [Fuerstiella sp.]